jgi:hypothetical protein
VSEPREIPGMGGLKGPSISGQGGDLEIDNRGVDGKLDTAFDAIHSNKEYERKMRAATSFQRFKKIAFRHWLPEETPIEDLKYMYKDLLSTDGRKGLLALMSDPTRVDDKVGNLLSKLRVGEPEGRGRHSGRLPPAPKRKDTSNSLASMQEEIIRATSPVLKEE